MPTALWTGGGSSSYLKEMFFGPRKLVKPDHLLPVLKTNLAALDKNRDLVVWLGHSSYFIQLGGRRILIDPVFSSHASPVPFLNKAFDGDYPYTPADMPDVDYVAISHDHWDHLDCPTMKALNPKIKAVVAALGIGSHLVRWGYAAEKIHEADWYEQISLEPGLNIHVLPARHFSGRGWRSNQTLWASFVLETPTRKIFYSGDSGYGPHFADVGERFGNVDLAIMENGQYDQHWAQVHMLPEEAVQATLDVRAAMLLPAHVGRFSLANHDWDEPYERISAASEGKNFRLLTPMVGEVTDLDNPNQSVSRWWKKESRR
ncbi:MAG: MBL fold metallo-hydrolase [Chloroflexota bacterium]